MPCWDVDVVPVLGSALVRAVLQERDSRDRDRPVRRRPLGQQVRQDAHNTMADYFFTDGLTINAIIVALADAFYEAAVDQQADSA